MFSFTREIQMDERDKEIADLKGKVTYLEIQVDLLIRVVNEFARISQYMSNSTGPLNMNRHEWRKNLYGSTD